MGACLTPFYVEKQDINVPCGKCPECRKRRISGWSFRLMQEYKTCTSAYFLTLTYDTEHVPITTRGFMDLRRRDVQLFFKRLRKAHVKADHFNAPIKYYACGEYGGKTKRPHYHIILYNAKLELIQPAWNIGQIHYGEVNEASVGYTLKYMSKPSTIPMHKNDDRTKEFSLMSKGLGKSYMSTAIRKWHNADACERMHCTLKDGKKIAMPRYYKEKIFSEYVRILAGKYQLIKMQQREETIIQTIGMDTYLQQKEHHKRAKFDSLNVTNSKRNKI